MLNVEKLARRPKVFQTLSGLTPERFSMLLQELEPRWEKAEIARKSWTGRTRRIGGGDTPKLRLPQVLFPLLLCYRTCANHIFIALVGGIDDSNVGRYFRRLEPVLAGIFAIPEEKVTLTDDAAWERIADATEQETERRPGSGFSGKRKRQTVKTQAHITRDRRIRAVLSLGPFKTSATRSSMIARSPAPAISGDGSSASVRAATSDTSGRRACFPSENRGGVRSRNARSVSTTRMRGSASPLSTRLRA